VDIGGAAALGTGGCGVGTGIGGVGSVGGWNQGKRSVSDGRKQVTSAKIAVARACELCVAIEVITLLTAAINATTESVTRFNGTSRPGLRPG
jgi:hypothetical protein